LAPGKALGQGGVGDAQFFAAGDEFLQAVKADRLHAAGPQKVQQALAPARAFGQDEGAVGRARQMGFEFVQRVFGATADR
jgi:predicted Zn-dependent protease